MNITDLVHTCGPTSNFTSILRILVNCAKIFFLWEVSTLKKRFPPTKKRKGNLFRENPHNHVYAVQDPLARPANVKVQFFHVSVSCGYLGSSAAANQNGYRHSRSNVIGLPSLRNFGRDKTVVHLTLS